MKPIQAVRALFIVGGLYDGVLGLAFLLAGPAIFNHFGVAPPNHPGYVQFPALLLLVFAWMFFAVAANPYANRNLILYGILLKLSYSGVVIYYWVTSGVPDMWKPFAPIDLVFAALFIWAISATRVAAPAGSRAP
jgi:hypothetical protein